MSSNSEFPQLTPSDSATPTPTDGTNRSGSNRLLRIFVFSTVVLAAAVVVLVVFVLNLMGRIDTLEDRNDEIAASVEDTDTSEPVPETSTPTSESTTTPVESSLPEPELIQPPIDDEVENPSETIQHSEPLDDVVIHDPPPSVTELSNMLDQDEVDDLFLEELGYLPEENELCFEFEVYSPDREFCWDSFYEAWTIPFYNLDDVLGGMYID